MTYDIDPDTGTVITYNGIDRNGHLHCLPCGDGQHDACRDGIPRRGGYNPRSNGRQHRRCECECRHNYSGPDPSPLSPERVGTGSTTPLPSTSNPTPTSRSGKGGERIP